MTGSVSRPVGVLVMAHGTPASTGEIAPFYTAIRRGRPPTSEQLAELEGRYRAIGGTSPLAATTRGQVAGLAAALESAEPGKYRVRFGAKHTAPSIEEGVAALGNRRCRRSRRVGTDSAPVDGRVGGVLRGGRTERRRRPTIHSG